MAVDVALLLEDAGGCSGLRTWRGDLLTPSMVAFAARQARAEAFH